MAEVFGAAGQAVEVTGTYACTLCGLREELHEAQSFPADHHPEHPWTLMVRADGDSSS